MTLLTSPTRRVITSGSVLRERCGIIERGRDYSKNSQLRGEPPSEETLKGLRERYGRVMVGMRKGILAALDRDRKTQLAVWSTTVKDLPAPTRRR